MIKIMLSRVLFIAKNILQFVRYGGYTTVNISQLNCGEVLKGKKVLITGGGTGIGFSIAQKAILEGADVVITGRSKDKLKKAYSMINSKNLNIITWDVSDVSIQEHKLQECKEILGGDIDILVNNAGIVNGVRYPNVTEEIWDQVYSTNSKGLFFLTQTLCKQWENTGNNTLKKVINISSQGGFVGALYPYRMTKWDIAGLTQGLGLRLAAKGIIVNGIAPGITSTPAVEKYYRQKENKYSDIVPLKRIALPEEIAELAIFLMSNSANFIVGQTIVCDGGYSLK